MKITKRHPSTPRTMTETELNELNEKYNQAMDALKLHHFDEAITILDEAARQGSLAAILRIAGIYYYGIGVEPNDDKAIEYLLLADYDARALLNLGHIYYGMEPTEGNTIKALDYYNLARRKDSNHALYLGKILFEGRVKDDKDYPILEEAETYFTDAFDAGEPISGLYLWKICQMKGKTSEGNEYLAETWRRLMMELNSPREYDNAAAALCSFGEYKMALPYIDSCMTIADEEEYPEYMKTYAAVLYGLGEKDRAMKTYARCMLAYQRECRNKELRETWETMKKKFSDNVSFRISIPEMEEYWGLAKKQ